MNQNLDFSCPECRGQVGRPRCLGMPLRCPHCDANLMPVYVTGTDFASFFYRHHKAKGNPLRADLERT